MGRFSPERRRATAARQAPATAPRRRATTVPGALDTSADALLALQRAVGNRAAVQLLRSPSSEASPAKMASPAKGASPAKMANPTKGASPAQGTEPAELARRGNDGTQDHVIRRAGLHFQSFLSQKVPEIDPANSPADKEVFVAAWMMDQNIYELADFLAGNLNETTMVTSSLRSHGLTIDDVKTVAAAGGAPDRTGSQQQFFSWLDGFIKTIPRTLTEKVSAHVQTKGKEATSAVNWMGLMPWGAGIGGELAMRPGGINKGSGAGGDPLWMKTVEQHIPPGGTTTLYVRGHLLNYDLGGPGLDYNMVPITGKPAKNVGGNDANGEHYHAVEAKAKLTLACVVNGTYTDGFYRVVPTYNRAPRAATARVRNEVTKLRAAMATDRARLSSEHAGKGASHVGTQYTKMYQGVGAPVPTPLPSPGDQLTAITSFDAHTVAEQTLAVLRNASHPLAVAVDTTIDRAILDASTCNKTDSCTINDLLGLLEGNAQTWEMEDTVIPTAVNVLLAWTPAGGTTQNPPINPVPVTLATDPTVVWFRPKKNAELA